MPDRRFEEDHDDENTELPDEEQEAEYAIECHQLSGKLRMPLDVALFIPGKDASNATERLFVRIAPRYRDWLASYTNDKRFPFRGMNHLLRWCIDQGLRKLDRIRPTPTLSTQVAALQTLLYEEQIAADFAALMQSADARITAYLSDGARGEAIRLVHRIIDEVSLMPDGYWKGKYAREIRTRWGKLMASPGIAMMLDSMIEVSAYVAGTDLE